jgi:hypothetical protein
MSKRDIRKDNELVPALRQQGPSPVTKLPVNSDSISPNQRRLHNVTRLFIQNRITTYSATAVYYIEGEHDLTDVVRTYIEVNPDILDLSSGQITQVFSEASRRFRKAWRDVRDEYDIDTPEHYKNRENQGAGPRNTECPLCGEEGLGQLAAHLSKCPER